MSADPPVGVGGYVRRKRRRGQGGEGLSFEAVQFYGVRSVLAFLTDPAVLHKILDHLKLPSSPPETAPARLMPQEGELFSEGGPEDAGFNGVRDRAFGSAVARAPP